MRNLLILWLIVLCPYAAWAVAPYSLDTTRPLLSIPAQPYLEIWEDESRTKTVQDVLRLNPEFSPYNFQELKGAGYSNSIYWVRLRLLSTAKVEQTLYLEATDPQQYLDFYSLESDERTIRDSQSIGSYRDISLQRLKHRFPTLELHTKPGLNTYLFRMDVLAVTFPYYLWTHDELLKKSSEEMIILAFLFGSFTILAVYNILLGFTTKRSEYFLYFGYLSSFILIQLFVTGAGRYYFGDSMTLLNQGLTLWIALLIVFSIKFLIGFLDLGPDRLPLVKRILNFYCLLCFIFAAVSCASQVLAMKFLPLLLTGLFFMIYAGTKEALRGYRPAKLYMIGWGFFLLGTVFLVSYYSGLFSDSTLVSWAMLIGASFQMIFFSLAIGDRLRQEADTNLEDLAVLLEKQQAEAKSREHAYRQLGKVFYPHQLQKMEKGYALETTMPVGSGRACVLQLDIVNSSQIQHANRQEFLTGFLKRCQSIMMTNYAPSTMQADAYRIKEMGDGFLCSVGYPFLLAKGTNPADHAVDLAERFFEAFQACVEELNYTKPIYCAIGIASGEIESYFPNTGTKEYDLYGKGIILASRYESLRKNLFDEVSSNLLILQDEVYASLSEGYRHDFTAVNLKKANIVVRDDPTAKNVYYRSYSESSAKDFDQSA